MDLFVVPTIAFDLLYVLVTVRLARRDLWFPTIPSGGIRAVRQNQRIIRCDARDPPFAGHTCRRFVQVAAQA
jgi:hypothetical protein